MKPSAHTSDVAAAGGSGAEFRAIFEVASVGIVQVDPGDGRLLRFNDKFGEITGYPAPELRALHFPELTHLEDRAGDWELFSRAARGEVPDYRNEKRCVRKDGTVIWVRLNAAFIRDPAGQTVSAVTVCEDITERKQAEQALSFLAQCGTAAGEDFFQSLARYLAGNLGMDFVCIDRLEGEGLRARTVAVFFDGKFEENLTYTLKETPCGALVGQQVCCFPAGVRHRFPKDAVLQQMQAESYVGVTLWGYSGKPIGLIAVIGRRALANPRAAEFLLKLVAGRAASELERKGAEEVLRRNQERLLMAQKAGRLGTFDLDFWSGKGFWSEERKRMVGVPADYEPTRDSWWSSVGAADRAALLADLARTFGARRREWEHRYRITQSDGRERWLEDRAWLTYDVTGQPVRMVGTSIDVTSEVQAKARARERQRQFRSSAVRTVAVLAASVFLAEALVMAVLARFPPLGPRDSAVLDSVMLVALVSPVLYFFAFRPLVFMLRQREEVEEALRRSNETLEARVKDRTASLEHANQTLASEVAERVKAEAESRRAKEEWERTFDAVPDLVAILDDRHAILRANRAMAQRLRLTPDQCVGRICHEVVHGTACPHGSCPHERTLADGAEHTLELSEPRLGGDFLVSTTPLLDDAGRQLGSVHVARDITARKRAEAALRVSEERYRTLFDAMTEGFVLFETLTDNRDQPCDYRFLEVNPAFELLTGLKRDSVLGRRVREVAPDIESHWISGFGTVALTGKPLRMENYTARLGRWYDVMAYRVAPGRFAAVFSDITARKQAEEALRDSREDLNHAQAVAHIGSWRLDVRRNLMAWSDETYDIFQIPRGEPLTYERFLAVVHPDDRERVDQSWKAALQGAPYDLEHRIVVNGVEKWVRGQGVLEWDAQGAAISGFGTVQDVTGWKQVESALAQARANLEQKVQERTAELSSANERLRQEIETRQRKEVELAEAERRYRTVADFTYDWEYWRAPAGELLYCSPACERITGYSAAELTATPGLLDQLIHPEHREQWRRHACETVTEPGPRAVLFRLRRKDGAVCWIEHWCRPVVGRKGEFLGVRASNRDVTERKQAEMEMAELRDELGRVTRITTAGQLSAALAHELNQPLGAIVCNVQAVEHLLAAEPADFAEIREALRDIETDSKRAGEVIHQLRSLFQRNGRTRTLLQLNQLLESTVQLLHSEFILKGVEARLDLEPHLPCIQGNEVELRQVVLNLITNALEAMLQREPGARRLNISTDCDQPGQVHVAIRDSGTGIPPEGLARVFEPFYTTKASGMGMGLAICRSILESHGGQLWAENNPDHGATFHLSLGAVSGGLS